MGEPVFPGESSVEQISEIVKVLGTPTPEDIKSMRGNLNQFKFPQIPKNQWNKVYLLELLSFFQIFKVQANPLAIDLLEKMLIYNPEKRIKPFDALAHPYFDDLRKEGFRIDGKKLNLNLFEFSQGIQKNFYLRKSFYLIYFYLVLKMN